MKRFPLIGVDATNQPVKYAKEVSSFTDHYEYFKVLLNHDGSFVTLITPKSSYTLHKHDQLNIFTGICGSHKVHVSLKKIVGELRFW